MMNRLEEVLKKKQPKIWQIVDGTLRETEASQLPAVKVDVNIEELVEHFNLDKE